MGLPRGLFPSGFPTKTLYLSPILATCPTLVILLDLITRIISDEFRSLCFSLCSLLYSPGTLSLLDPPIFFSTLSSDTLSLCGAIRRQIYVSLSVCSVVI